MSSSDSSKQIASPARKIGILGHVGTKNLGDETIIAAVLQNIRLRFPEAEIRAFTFQPDDTQQRHGIQAFPIRQINRPSVSLSATSSNVAPLPASSSSQIETGGLRSSLKKIPLLYPCLKGLRDAAAAINGFFKEAGFLAQSYRNLKGTDLLIVAGSGQLTEHSGGPWGYPYTFLKWSLLARVAGTELTFVSIGTSWIETPLSRFFLRFALSRASYRSYRDEGSREQIVKWGPRGEIVVAPDLAYSYHMPEIASRPAPAPTSSLAKGVVGINPIPYYHETMWHEADKARYDEYVQTQAAFAVWLIRRGYQVLFFPTQLRADPVVIADIVQLLGRDHPDLAGYALIEPPMRTHEDLIAKMQGMDFVVAARFHGVLISHLLLRPVLGVCYHRKTSDLMAQMNQSACALDTEGCAPEALIERFSYMESHRESIAEEMARSLPSRRKALDSQYEKIFSLMKSNPVSTQVSKKPKVWSKEPSNARINYGS